MDRRSYAYTPIIIVGFLSAIVAGCARLPLDPEYAGPETLNETVLQPYSYKKREIAYRNEVLDETSRYTIRRIEFTPAVSLVGEHALVIDYYDPRSDRPTPVVLVLPILGGDNDLARHFAKMFARSGLAAAIVHRQEDYKDTNGVEELNRVFRQIVLDHRQAIDWIESRPELDHDRIGLFGISAGGVKGALVCALEERIDSAVLALAGGDLPYILAYSTEKGIARRRRKILEENGITQAQLHETLTTEFAHDPLQFAKYIDARQTLLVLARFDAVVPYKCGLSLREAMGNPETVILPSGHYTSILYLPYVESRSLRFLKERLDQSCSTD